MRRTTRRANDARRARSCVRNRHPRKARARVLWSAGAKTECASARWRAERVAPCAHARNARAADLCVMRHTSARARLVCAFERAAASRHPSNAEAVSARRQRSTTAVTFARRRLRSLAFSRQVRNALCDARRVMRTAKSMALSRAASTYITVVAHSANAACRSRRRHFLITADAFRLACARRAQTNRHRSSATALATPFERVAIRRDSAATRSARDARAPEAALHRRKDDRSALRSNRRLSTASTCLSLLSVRAARAQATNDACCSRFRTRSTSCDRRSRRRRFPEATESHA